MLLHRPLIFAAAWMIVWIGSVVQVHAAPRYNIVALEPLPGGESFAFGLNDRGQVVGDSRKDRFGNVGQWRPVVWDNSGQPTELWSEQGIGGHAEDINNAGQVVGRYGSGSGIPLPGPGVRPGRAFVWSAETGRTDLGIGEFGFSETVAINERGQVVGTSEVFDVVIIDGVPTLDNLRIHPFIWDAESGIRDLGTLGGNAAFATDINAHGQVVGYSENEEGRTRAFVWDEAGGMRQLPSIADGGTRAAAINDLGQIIGSEVGTGAVMWNLQSGSVTPIPGARDINNRGLVLGGISIWNPIDGRHMLSDLIPPDSGWEISLAFAINDAGKMAGYGQLDGQIRGFLMIPVPEPQAIVQFTLCFLTLGFSRVFCGHRQRWCTAMRPTGVSDVAGSCGVTVYVG